MLFTTVHSIFLATLLSFTSSAALEKRIQQYLLQTTIIENNNDTGTPKGGLYVYSYHTGAGLGDAALSPNISVGEAGNLNGTEWLLQLGSFPTPLQVATDTPDTYQTFWPVHASQADFDGTATTDNYMQVWNGKLQYVQPGLGPRVSGWLACDWWHGVPQLFFLNGADSSFYYQYYEYPSACSLVSLNLVPV